MIVGTAGHVDHGKTSLVKALTGIDTDRLPEEKRRGITLELGFAHLALPSGRTVGVVDVPGHERFVKAMAAGAGGIDLALLVVAADEGVMPQTREHIDICTLLGLSAGVLVVTKGDLLPGLGEGWLELLEADLRALVVGTPFEHAPLVTVSSKTGEGLDALKSTLDEKSVVAASAAEALAIAQAAADGAPGAVAAAEAAAEAAVEAASLADKDQEVKDEAFAEAYQKYTASQEELARLKVAEEYHASTPKKGRKARLAAEMKKGQPYHFKKRMDDDDIQDYVRPWVGLTDEEKNEITWGKTVYEILELAEAKLKEKNT
jgi:small GTP-binding protein